MTATDINAPLESLPPPRPARSKAPYVVLVVLGALLVGLGLVLTGAVAPLEAALVQQRNGGFVTSPTQRYEVGTYAITSQQLDVVLDGSLAAQDRNGAAATVMLRAASATPGEGVFIGIGPQTEVAAYLADVDHSELTQLRFNPFQASYRDQVGSKEPAPPADQDFWVVSAQGPGTQQIESNVRAGNWAVVIMNADGSRPVAVDLAAGVRSPLLAPVTWATLIAGLVLLAISIPAVVAGAAGLGRAAGASNSALPTGPGSLPPTGPAAPEVPANPAYPARLTGELDPGLSRWKWLVKWFLAIPHYLVLAFLGMAFLVTTVISGVSILFTGTTRDRCSTSTSGVLRWGWRVTFYASAFGTDRYPPFTLARADYPADFDVDYPERLSHGLVLVKSWLLAIPHLLIIGLATANLTLWWSTRQNGSLLDNPGGISLIGVLALVAGVALLITKSYPRSLFALIMGIYRWSYRVLTYVALLRDEYPPFQLDQGPADPGTPQLDPVTAPQPVTAGI